MNRLRSAELNISHYFIGAAIFVTGWFLPLLLSDQGAGSRFRNLHEALFITTVTLLIFSFLLICEGWLLVFFITSRGKGLQHPILILAIQGFIAGSLSAVITYPFLNNAESHRFSLLTRALQLGILAGTWIPLLLVAVASKQQLKTKQAILLRQLQLLVRLEHTQSGVLEQVKNNFENSIRSSLQVTALEAHAKLILAFSSEGRISSAIPDLVRELASSDMRQLSHAMMQNEYHSNLISPTPAEEKSRFEKSFSAFLKVQGDFIKEDPWWWTIFLLIGTFSSRITGSISIVSQLELTIILSLTMSLIFKAFSVLARRFEVLSRSMFIPLIAVLCYTNQLIITSLITLDNSTEIYYSWSNRLLLIITITLSCILARLALLFLFSTLTSKNYDLNYEFQMRKAAHELHADEYLILAHKWAKHIHGTVQSQLLSAAGRLEIALERSDFDSYNQSLLEIKELLGKPDEEIDILRRNLEEEVEHKKWLWIGLMQIDGVIDVGVQVEDLASIQAIGRVFEEALSNSYRHGNATQVNYHLVMKDIHELAITISDNGKVLKAERSRINGLGSKIFSQVSRSNFQIHRNEALGLTTLEIVVSL